MYDPSMGQGRQIVGQLTKERFVVVGMDDGHFEETYFVIVVEGCGGRINDMSINSNG